MINLIENILVILNYVVINAFKNFFLLFFRIERFLIFSEFYSIFVSNKFLLIQRKI